MIGKSQGTKLKLIDNGDGTSSLAYVPLGYGALHIFFLNFECFSVDYPMFLTASNVLGAKRQCDATTKFTWEELAGENSYRLNFLSGKSTATIVLRPAS
jgi:hypothetical protein